MRRDVRLEPALIGIEAARRAYGSCLPVDAQLSPQEGQGAGELGWTETVHQVLGHGMRPRRLRASTGDLGPDRVQTTRHRFQVAKQSSHVHFARVRNTLRHPAEQRVAQGSVPAQFSV